MKAIMLKGQVVTTLAVLLGVLFFQGTPWAVQVGDKAPDFKLPATTGKDMTLGQFKGKKMVLVEFYVADFGPT